MYPTIDEKIMLEKRYGRRTPLPTYTAAYTDVPRSRTRRSVFTYIALVAFIFSTVLFGIPSVVRMYSSSMSGRSQSDAMETSGTRSFAQTAQSPINSGEASASNQTLVPLEAHIMSKCPDARDCLRELIVPVMAKAADKVDFQLSYIGSVDSEGNIECMHGPTECLGNMMGLCAQHTYPNDVKRWLGFTNCLISSYQRIPDKDLAQGCALEHGIDFDKLNACMSEEGTGLNLLEASVKRSEDAGVTKSCTVRVGGEIWTIRDGGQWKDYAGGHDVDGLVKELEKRYEDGLKKES